MATIFQQANQILTFKFSFNGSQEQAVSIRLAGREVANRNSDFNNPDFVTERNLTGLPLEYLVIGFHKHERTGHHPWITSKERVIISPSSTVIGYDDTTPNGNGDNDFNDAVVTVLYSS